MSMINVLNIIVHNPKAKFTDKFSFQIAFECLGKFEKEIEWKMIYIGCADNEKYDQILDTVEIGPLKEGTMKFDFNVENSPDYTKIPKEDVLGVTAILLCCSYNNQEFFRVGYYLNNTYDNEQMNENPPDEIDINHIVRTILVDKPRITRFNINWDDEQKNYNFDKYNNPSGFNVKEKFGNRMFDNANHKEDILKNFKDN